MLAYFNIADLPKGQSPGAILLGLAERLSAQGLSVAGVAEGRRPDPEGGREIMELRFLDRSETIRISQNLGPMAQGCRLDIDGLERAAGQVARSIETGADVLIVNKFGKQEREGRGFRPVIGQALVAGCPVVVGLSTEARQDFLAFAEGLGTEVSADADALANWVLTATST